MKPRPCVYAMAQHAWSAFRSGRIMAQDVIDNVWRRNIARLVDAPCCLTTAFESIQIVPLRLQISSGSESSDDRSAWVQWFVTDQYLV